jgi:hypothetical protein
MSDPDRKKKMISIRLSQGEYEGLKAHYGAYGAHNVSELARLALQRMAESAGPQDNFATKLSQLDERVHTLESQVSDILERALA